jgi:AraC-like DNA-binding protein
LSVVGSSLQTDIAQRLRVAHDFIEENLHREDLTPALVAQALGISLRQLHIMFAPTGQSFSRYVLSRRLERARLQLSDFPDRAVIDVALACGIKSSSVFYRGFRDAFGMNPSSYRKLRPDRSGGKTDAKRSLGRRIER